MVISDEEAKKGLMTLNMIWFAMLFSMAVYLFVGIQAAGNLQTSMSPDTLTIAKSVLYLFAIVVLVGTRYVKKILLSAKDKSKQATLSDANPIQRPALRKYTTVMMIAWAMSESIGICGLIIFFLGKNVMDLYLLIAGSAVAIFLYRPKMEEIVALSQESFETIIGRQNGKAEKRRQDHF
jgi:hypothetical protein